MRKYMKYLALSILAVRAICCLALFRGKILCQRFASSWFEFSCNTRSKNFTLFCIFWQPGRSIALFAEIFCLNGSFIIRSDLLGIYVIGLFGSLIIRSDLFGIYVIGLFGSLIIRSDLFGIYVIGLFGSLIWVRAF